MRARINDTELYFDIHGAALEVGTDLQTQTERPTIVAIPGGPGFDHVHLKPCLRPLSALAQVVYVDPRGIGRSGRPPVASCTLEQSADDIVGLCDLLGIDRPYLFGHSGGGFVALTAAVRYPKRFAGLILNNTVAAFEPADATAPKLADRASPAALAAGERFWGGDMSPESLSAFAELVGPYYVASGNEELARVLRLGSISQDMMAWWFANEARSYDLRSKLSAIEIPALVFTSVHDWVCSPGASRKIAAGIPCARLVELSRSVHLSMIEEPERFLEEVRAFLGG